MYQPNLPPDDEHWQTSTRSRQQRRHLSVAHQDNSQNSSASTQPTTRATVVGTKHVRQQQQVRQLPQPDQSVPVWLKSLLTIQQGSMVLFCSTIGLSSIVYGCTVYTQDTWKDQYGQLKRLQTQERQQGVMNENLKQQMAQAAEQPDSGLIAPNPERMVFIPSAPQRPTKSIPIPQLRQPAPASKPPSGY